MAWSQGRAHDAQGHFNLSLKGTFLEVAPPGEEDHRNARMRFGSQPARERPLPSCEWDVMSSAHAYLTVLQDRAAQMGAHFAMEAAKRRARDHEADMCDQQDRANQTSHKVAQQSTREPSADSFDSVKGPDPALSSWDSGAEQDLENSTSDISASGDLPCQACPAESRMHWDDIKDDIEEAGYHAESRTDRYNLKRDVEEAEAMGVRHSRNIYRALDTAGKDAEAMGVRRSRNIYCAPGTAGKEACTATYQGKNVLRALGGVAKEGRTRSRKQAAGRRNVAIDQATVNKQHEGPVTTLMLSNIPCRITQSDLQETLGEMGFDRKYNFLHVPMANRKRSNLGYAFVNLLTAEDAKLFTERFTGFRFVGLASRKVCEVRPAEVQGLAASTMQFSNPRNLNTRLA